MITMAQFMGRAEVITLNGADKSVHPFKKRVVRVEIGSGIAAITLPDARILRTGGPQLLIINATGVALPLKDVSGNLIVTPDLPAGQACLLSLTSNATANGAWRTEFQAWFSH